MRSEHCASQLDAANWCSAREHLNSFQLIQAVAVFLVLHRSFAAWAVGGLLRESQQFSPIRSQTLMPSFFCVAGSAVQSRPASPEGLQPGEGFSFGSFVFLYCGSLGPAFPLLSCSWLFIRISSRVESSLRLTGGRRVAKDRWRGGQVRCREVPLAKYPAGERPVGKCGQDYLVTSDNGVSRPWPRLLPALLRMCEHFFGKGKSF